MSPVVICVEFQSFVSAVAAMEEIIKFIGPGACRTRMQDALNDFNRAHATACAIDAHITTPALLRRQAE